MAVVEFPAGATDRIWYKHVDTNDLYDVVLGSDEEVALSGDADYDVVTEWETTSGADSLAQTPTEMP